MIGREYPRHAQPEKRRVAQRQERRAAAIAGDHKHQQGREHRHLGQKQHEGSPREDSPARHSVRREELKGRRSPQEHGAGANERQRG